MKTGKVLILCVAICLVFAISASANTVWKNLEGSKPPVVLGAKHTGMPNTEIRVHKVGNTHMTVTNFGILGSQIGNGYVDPETGLWAPSCEHPAYTDEEYLFQAALWIGAIVGGDTLVSVGADGWQHVNEMFPQDWPGGQIEKRSTRPNDNAYHPDAVSEADYLANYQDTLTDYAYVPPTPFDDRPHIPLGLDIRQESYSWSDPKYDDFIIVKYIIRNIGIQYLHDVYFGFYFDADIFQYHLNPSGFDDDISGLYTFTDPQTGNDIQVAWSADNDGDPSDGFWGIQSVLGVLGVSMLEFPEVPDMSFNWWVSEQYLPAYYDWGPMMTANYREFGTGGLGTPEGDCNKYYIMSNGEFDYDQMFTAIDHTSEGWMGMPLVEFAQMLASGYDTRFLFSFGAVDLGPGDSVEFALVVTVADDFHQNPNDYNNLFHTGYPEDYYDALDFSDIENDIMAARNLYESISMEYVKGDANYDSEVTIADIVYLINFIFLGGDKPNPYLAGDNNCDGKVNLTDIVYLINYLFRGGNEPCDMNGDGVPDC
jgi:hypothetical protein